MLRWYNFFIVHTYSQYMSSLITMLMKFQTICTQICLFCFLEIFKVENCRVYWAWKSKFGVSLDSHARYSSFFETCSELIIEIKYNLNDEWQSTNCVIVRHFVVTLSYETAITKGTWTSLMNFLVVKARDSLARVTFHLLSIIKRLNNSNSQSIEKFILLNAFSFHTKFARFNRSNLWNINGNKPISWEQFPSLFRISLY